MVRRSHVVMEFIGVGTGNGHYMSGKLVAIRHNAYDRALSVQRHALGVRTTKHNERDRFVLSRQRILCRDLLLIVANNALYCVLFEQSFMDTVHGHCSYRVSKFWFPIQWDPE